MGAKQKTPKRKNLKPWDKPAWQKAQKKAKKGRKQPKYNVDFAKPISLDVYYSQWEKWQASAYKMTWDFAWDDMVIQHDPEEAIQETIDFNPRITMWDYLNHYGKEADASQDSSKTNT